MILAIYGYAPLSKTDGATRNLETQPHIPQEYGIKEEHIFADEMTGSSMSRPASNELMTRPFEGLSRHGVKGPFNRNFDERVNSQTDLTKEDISSVAVLMTAGIYRIGNLTKELLQGKSADPVG